MGETVSERYRKALPGSWARWERARRVIPGGITHDGRHLTPFPLYVDRAAGPRKWDVDGHEYIDYWMGHGALFLGHCHPAVVEAVQDRSRGARTRRLPRARGALGRVDHQADPLRRDGALHHVRHRGDASRAAPRARLHGAPQGREVHGPLPRLARRGLLGREPALRRADVGRDPGRGPGRGPARPPNDIKAVEQLLGAGATSRPSSSSRAADSPAPSRSIPDSCRTCASSRRTGAPC